jgi:hypothetical protein
MLSPDVKIVSFTVNSIRTEQAVININNAMDVWLEDCEIAYEYNKLLQTKKICYSFTDRVEYQITI